MNKKQVEEKAKKEGKEIWYEVEEKNLNGETWKNTYWTDADFSTQSVDEDGNRNDIPWSKKNVSDNAEVKIIVERDRRIGKRMTKKELMELSQKEGKVFYFEVVDEDEEEEDTPEHPFGETMEWRFFYSTFSPVCIKALDQYERAKKPSEGGRRDAISDDAEIEIVDPEYEDLPIK